MCVLGAPHHNRLAHTLKDPTPNAFASQSLEVCLSFLYIDVKDKCSIVHRLQKLVATTQSRERVQNIRSSSLLILPPPVRIYR